MINKISPYFQKPKESVNASQLLIYALWVMRIFTTLLGVYQILFGETIIGIAILICVVALVTPAILTKNRFSDIPLEIEFILFCAVFMQFIVGEAHDFYTEVPYYDKFVHLMLPFLIGYTGFVITYTMYFSKRLIVSPRTMVLAVIIITMGIGAIWEIIEYSSDLFLYPVIPGWHKFQGSIAEDSFHDTMNDLVADLIGGIFGAILAFKYTWNKDEKSPRLRELLTEISNQLFRKH